MLFNLWKVVFVCVHFVVIFLFFQITPAVYETESWHALLHEQYFSTHCFWDICSWVMQSSTKSLIPTTTISWSIVLTFIIHIKVFFRMNYKDLKWFPYLKRTSKEENYRPVSHFLCKKNVYKSLKNPKTLRKY